jgi:hypothetical protein
MPVPRRVYSRRTCPLCLRTLANRGNNFARHISACLATADGARLERSGDLCVTGVKYIIPIDYAAKRKGTVTFDDWDKACLRVEAALSAAGEATAPSETTG